MNKKIIVTGCGGLIGGETSDFFINLGYTVLGIDNNMREYYFGKDGSVSTNIESLKSRLNFIHYNIDIRNYESLSEIFANNIDISLIVHAAAQPSHDWAVKEPFTDYAVNSTSTLNLLELYRKYCPEASFIFLSTNKVYGDNPNKLPFIEMETRFELDSSNPYYMGINEEFSIDSTRHSLFGCSKLSADIYVQEYGKYFGLKTNVLRGGCLTGSKHKGAELHGFLNYLVKCNIENRVYNVFGYNGKQVRDNIHSSDLVSAIYEIYLNPKFGEVYNIGGGRESNCSIIEAVKIIENITNQKTKINYVEKNRIGDHIWWITDDSKLKRDYPEWTRKHNIESIINEIIVNYGY